MTQSYADFLKAKVRFDHGCGFELKPEEVNALLKPHQRDSVIWAVRGGRRALFEAFGLGKSMMQLEIVRLTLLKAQLERGLIVMPLGVRSEFIADAKKLDIPVTFIRTTEEAVGPGIYLTNYESVREGKVDPAAFQVVSLDEAAILRGFGGTKTFRELMATMAGDDRRSEGNGVGQHEIRYRFVATATPSPNEFIELLAYAAFLGIMDVGQAKTRFFKRNSEKADELTIHEHKKKEFWLWVSSWALFVQQPSDLGHSDDGYELPQLAISWHEIPTNHAAAGHDKDGQGRLLRNTAIGVVDASREKRDSLPARIEKLRQIVKGRKEQLVIWCDLNDEQKVIEQALSAEKISHASLYGADAVDDREALLGQWKGKKRQAFVSKPSMYGAGVNLQQAHTMIFAGIGFKFSEMIQAVHRIHRFLQTKPCTVHLIYTEAERDVKRQLEQKWAQHEELVANMTAIIREYGLSQAAMAHALNRSLGIERREEAGDGWTLANNDCVEETARMPANSVGLILTSVPFATQYEYSPSYNDFGHTDDEAHFFRQMDYLAPELYRVLMPGRVLAVHVKDRIMPMGLSGMGFQVVTPFSDMTVAHYRQHGFGFLGRKTIVTDVVRENAQTYRLGWTEKCKDGSKMGCGMPEYLLLFRKPPTDRSRAYSDVPVVKSKTEYSRARWQFDAHGYMRSSGDRLLTPEDLVPLAHDQIFKAFKKHSLSSIYDFEIDVTMAETLDMAKKLPPSVMLLQPQSWHPDVWTDVARMRTLNSTQAQKGKEMHLCPLQFDIVDRTINERTNPGELVYDPFAGLGTVPLCAVKLGRRGYGAELSPSYFQDAVWHLRAAETRLKSPTLFDLDAEPSTKELA